MIRILGTVFAALLGLAFGSFLNVCLSRWPEGESIVTPRSHCRHCGRVLKWWENVPLLSWLALRGRCRTCHARIGSRYVIIEVLVGALWAIVAWRALAQLNDSFAFDLHYTSLIAGVVPALGMAAFCFLLVALAALDAEYLWLPDAVTLPGIALGILYSISLIWQSVPSITMQSPFWRTIAERLLAVLVAAGLILLIRWTYWLIRRSEGIGLGDAKLMALLAAWLGLPATLLAFCIGVIVGAVVAVFVLLWPRSRQTGEKRAFLKLPLGTFLCIGGIVSALWGQPILAAYLRWAAF